jgi:hypothetical protein
VILAKGGGNTLAGQGLQHGPGEIPKPRKSNHGRVLALQPRRRGSNMKNSVPLPTLFLLWILLFEAAAFGQQKNQNDARGDTSRVPREMQGCLRASNGNYTLETATGVVYQVRGDQSLIGPHVDQQVDAVGMEIVSTPSSVPAKSNPRADADQTVRTEPIAPPAFEVSKILKLKDKCYTAR